MRDMVAFFLIMNLEEKRMGAKRMGGDSAWGRQRMELKTPVLTDKREDYKAPAHGGDSAWRSRLQS